MPVGRKTAAGRTAVMTLEQEIERLSRGVVDILPEGELGRRLREVRARGQVLRVKFGADPSAPDLHLGHAVVLRTLRDFQDCGHEVVFLIGDFTGMIGDPTGKSETRPALTREQVLENAGTYQEQVFRILDPGRTIIRFNSEWMDGMKAAEVVRLCGHMTVARMAEREDFANRLATGRAIGLHEFLYPLIQGYDSVVLDADVEVGGTDQRFNLLVGRDLQKAWGQTPQVVLTLPLLEGTDGRQKMSKSLGNAIGVADDADTIFGRTMSIADELVTRWASLLGFEFAAGAIEEIGPMAAKKNLAEKLSTWLCGAEEASRARTRFEHRFQLRESYEPELRELVVSEAMSLARLLVQLGFASSGAAARRLIVQGGVRIDGERATDGTRTFHGGDVVLVAAGRRHLARVRLVLSTEGLDHGETAR